MTENAAPTPVARRQGELLFAGVRAPSRLTYRLRRLVEQDPAQRSDSDEDGRVALAHLTAEGANLLAAVSPAQSAQVRSMIVDRLDETQVEALEEAMHAVASGLTDEEWWLIVAD